VRTYRPTAGPVREAPFYTLSDIETVCTDALRAAALLPAAPEPIRIDRFVEKHFRVAIEYKDLPAGVLGYTSFGAKGVSGIAVSRALSEDPSRVSERQVSSTLAHEAGHGLLQAHLFALDEAGLGSLFKGEVDPAAPRILCRDPPRAGGKRYDGRWWEFQANQAIGALLLPRQLATLAVQPYLVAKGTFGLPALDPGNREVAARKLAELFDVNPAVVRIRLHEMFPPNAAGQLTL
jgi:hypothetical protein